MPSQDLLSGRFQYAFGRTIREYYELNSFKALNSDLLFQLLNRLKETIAQNRPALVNRGGIMFHQDNSRPHTSIVTHKKFRVLDWEILMYPVITMCSCLWRMILLVDSPRFLPIGTRVSSRVAL